VGEAHGLAVADRAGDVLAPGLRPGVGDDEDWCGGRQYVQGQPGQDAADGSGGPGDAGDDAVVVAEMALAATAARARIRVTVRRPVASVAPMSRAKRRRAVG
jgi:hypothetical protein